jgi:hypothetical protein
MNGGQKVGIAKIYRAKTRLVDQRNTQIVGGPNQEPKTAQRQAQQQRDQQSDSIDQYRLS